MLKEYLQTGFPDVVITQKNTNSFNLPFGTLKFVVYSPGKNELHFSIPSTFKEPNFKNYLSKLNGDFKDIDHFSGFKNIDRNSKDLFKVNHFLCINQQGEFYYMSAFVQKQPAIFEIRNNKYKTLNFICTSKKITSKTVNDFPVVSTVQFEKSFDGIFAMIILMNYKEEIIQHYKTIEHFLTDLKTNTAFIEMLQF